MACLLFMTIRKLKALCWPTSLPVFLVQRVHCVKECFRKSFRFYAFPSLSVSARRANAICISLTCLMIMTGTPRHVCDAGHFRVGAVWVQLPLTGACSALFCTERRTSLRTHSAPPSTRPSLSRLLERTFHPLRTPALLPVCLFVCLSYMCFHRLCMPTFTPSP